MTKITIKRVNNGWIFEGDVFDEEESIQCVYSDSEGLEPTASQASSLLDGIYEFFSDWTRSKHEGGFTAKLHKNGRSQEELLREHLDKETPEESTDNKTWITTVKEDKKLGCYIDIPPEVIETLQWDETTELQWSETEIWSNDGESKGLLLEKKPDSK